MSGAIEWISGHPGIVTAAVVVSVVTFVGTLVVVPILIVRIRADYFAGPQPSGVFRNRHPVVRIAGVVAKNLLGVVLVAMGVVMLFTPGQGLLSLLIGVSLLDFPGKRRLERRFARQRHVRRSIDWIRRRHGRPPLVFDDDHDDPVNRSA